MTSEATKAKFQLSSFKTEVKVTQKVALEILDCGNFRPIKNDLSGNTV